MNALPAPGHAAPPKDQKKKAVKKLVKKAAKAKPDSSKPTPAQITNLVKVKLGSLASVVTITVLDLPADHHALALTGTVDSATDLAKARANFLLSPSLPSQWQIDDQILLKDLPADQATKVVQAALGPFASALTYPTADLPDKQHTMTIVGTLDSQNDVALVRTKLVAHLLPDNWRLVDQMQAHEDTPTYRYLDSNQDSLANDGETDNAKKTFKTRIEPAAGGTTLVYLTPLDTLHPPSTVRFDHVEAAFKVIDPKVVVVRSLPPAEPIVREYKLHFLRDSLPGAVGSNATTSTSDISGIGVDQAAAQIAAQLAKVYPVGGPIVSSQENALLTTGDPAQVRHLQQMLALYLDVPSPQVRADILTIQINSTNINSRKSAQDKANEIRAGIQLVRDVVAGSMLEINQYIAKDPEALGINTNLDTQVTDTGDLKTDPAGHLIQVKDNASKSLSSEMKSVGFDTDARRPLSLVEMIIFLRFANPEKLKLDFAGGGEMAGLLTRSLGRIQAKLDQSKDKAPGMTELITKIQNRIAKTPGDRLLPRFIGAYGGNSLKPDLAALSHFLNAWYACANAFESQKTLPGSPFAEDALPGRLAAASAATDADLKNGMDALSADLQYLYFQPLLDWIREDVQGDSEAGSGLDIVGVSRLMVRDRTLAESTGSAQAYTKFTPIPQLTLQNLKDAQTLSAGTGTQTSQIVATDHSGNVILDSSGTTGNPVTLSNGQSIAFDPKTGNVIRKTDGTPLILTNAASTNPLTALGALNPAAALGITALMQAQPDPVYRSIAPGTSIALRPFVVPSGGAARVQINLVSAVGGDSTTAANQGGPLDSVTKQSITTETDINAFDLVEVASFGAQTTAPGDYRWAVPVLDQIPVLGDIFHGPRGKETHRQESIAIINLTIIPRSLDLVPFYNPSPQ